jgi:hypothetical protein
VGVAATPWLLIMLLGSPSTESEMSMQLYAAVRRAQQQARHRAVGNLWCGRSSFFLHHEIHRSLGAVLNDLHHHAE